MQIFRQSEVLANLNKSLADELNQRTRFPTARSNTKIQLEKVALDGSVECCALDGSVECCAPPPQWCDLEL